MVENEFKLIASGFNIALSRLLIFDYEGALVAPVPEGEAMEGSFRVDLLLKKLTDDERNDVMVISRLPKEVLSQVLKNEKVFLLAEDGKAYKEPGGNWQSLIYDYSTHWIPETYQALKTLEFQFEGSFLEKDEYSVIWHYQHASDIAAEDLKGIREAIMKLPGSEHFVIIDQVFAIQLKAAHVAGRSFLYHWLMKEPYDFTLALSAAPEAEDFFSAFAADIHSVRVGQRSGTAARFRLDGQEDVLPFLKKLLDTNREFEQLMPFINLAIYRLN